MYIHPDDRCPEPQDPPKEKHYEAIFGISAGGGEFAAIARPATTACCITDATQPLKMTKDWSLVTCHECLKRQDANNDGRVRRLA